MILSVTTALAELVSIADGTTVLPAMFGDAYTDYCGRVRRYLGVRR